MRAILPVILAGLVTVAAAEAEAAPETPHPLTAYAEMKTAQMAEAGTDIRVTYDYDEATNTLHVTGRLPAVLNRFRIRLLGPTLIDAYRDALSQDIDMGWLTKMGVAVAFALVDRNRTPIRV